jgi:uncharacterized protein (DUF488 family)
MEKIYTIGYGALIIDDFIQRLKDHKIHTLVDVRSRPYSKYNPDYSKKPLIKFLNKNNIEYIFLGNLIGGQPEDKEFYDSEGHLDYTLYKKSNGYSNGIKALVRVVQDGERISLMCAESDPERCHRSRLIAETLFRMRIDVSHILPDGGCIDHVELRKKFFDKQFKLFE